MMSFEQILPRLAAQTVLCVGDLMLDEFIYGEVSRISPEAATPVLAVKRRETDFGGAGNVARNIASLGAHCLLVAVVGDDEEGRSLAAALKAQKQIEAQLVIDDTRPTTRKARFVSEHHSTHLLRADWELARPIAAEIEDRLIEKALAAIGRADALILSDYAKGVLTPRVVRALIEAARAGGKPVVVDPKGVDYALYRGATVITPNRKEIGEAVRRAAGSDAEIEAAAAEVARIVGSEAVLVTRSEDGLTLYRREGAAVHVPAYPVRVRDVSGAGDTVAAVTGTLLAAGADFEAAARTANAAAAIVVGKRGTASVSLAELRARLLPHAVLAAEEKIVFDRRALHDVLEGWRRVGLRIGFTNGCFDLLHPGHVKLLTDARAACDRLVVGLNSDASVAGLKGAGRPIQDQHARAQVLAALEAVDLVVLFDEPTPIDLIREVRPKVLVKGSDYRREEVVGADFVEATGGEVLLVDIVPGQSTSRIVAQSRRSGT
ncbi:MAG TPA: D-glycero-beta-D-manno-heptose-7-phosphate kinase [Xanthobacteraceae bacterium]|nr:D-glycero-beta-D-manno-heptose-7-phosphate kinase [Xanthobacteraceae bacterium]